ncbi:hypothetical protein ACM66B_002802 [Microbotryomycetes sp. NB124-2]
MPAPATVDKGKATFTPQTPSNPTLLGREWLGVVECSASEFDPRHFYEAALLQILHPEYNSSTILRSDVIVDVRLNEAHDKDGKPFASPPPFAGVECARRVRRRIVPKQTRDKALEQECWIYKRQQQRQNGQLDHDDDANEEEEEVAEQAHLVVLDVDLDYLARENNGKMPYYHPSVSSLAISYLGTGDDAKIRLDFKSLPDEPLPQPLPLTHRLYRTALALLKHLHSVAIGTKNGYEKRVNHDVLTDRDSVQNIYRELKERYRWMLKEWKEVTDPSKHVWEDVAIAAWLIVLWRDLYRETNGKPPGGFVDVGCGNGLLVYILSCEGFQGYGIDLRARKSWSAYSPPPDLRTSTLDPPTLLSLSTPPFTDKSFLIGNHADELTPWLPLMAAKSIDCKFLNIPCCLHTHTTRFTAQDYTIPEEFIKSLPTPVRPSSSSNVKDDKLIELHPLVKPFFEPTPTLLARPTTSTTTTTTTTAASAGVTLSTRGRSDAYQLYLAEIMLKCGYVPQREALRIPSTKNFGLCGTERVWQGVGFDQEEVVKNEWKERVRGYVEEVVQSSKSEFVARKQKGSCV